MTPQQILNKAKGKRVLVIGDLILDEYIDGTSTRLSPEAPIPVVSVSSSRYVLGGAANVAANIVALGGRATVISSLSEDVEGDILTDLMDKAGIEYFGPIVDKPTTVKTRVSSGGQQIVRYDQEDVTELSEEKTGDALKIISMMISEFDVIVLSDYNKGLFTKDLCDTIIILAHEKEVDIISDMKPENNEFFLGSDIITPNWKEATEITNNEGLAINQESLLLVSSDLNEMFEVPVLITLGSQGLFYYDGECSEKIHLKANAKEVFDVSGAGDTVVAALALSICANALPLDMMTLCNKAAGIVVGKMGTSVATAAEVSGSDNRMLKRDELYGLTKGLRLQGKHVVTINGAFDLCHPGHIRTLQKAKELGDVLIVGVNSDNAVQLSKGPGRPIINETGRMETLLSLECVDYVHLFDEATPVNFLEEIRPDIHVNSSEYGEDPIEKKVLDKHGCKLYIITNEGEISTSSIIKDMLKGTDKALEICNKIITRN